MAEYIEREAFIEILETKNDCEHYADKVCCDFAIRMVNLMPTADVQEVRYGKWVEQLDGTHYCSYCGRDATYTFDGNEVCGIKCTYCGATMDKERLGMKKSDKKEIKLLF